MILSAKAAAHTSLTKTVSSEANLSRAGSQLLVDDAVDVVSHRLVGPPETAVDRGFDKLVQSGRDVGSRRHQLTANSEGIAGGAAQNFSEAAKDGLDDGHVGAAANCSLIGAGANTGLDVALVA